MTTFEDRLTEDDKEDVEQAKLESKRSKTKYGDQIECDDGE